MRSPPGLARVRTSSTAVRRCCSRWGHRHGRHCRRLHRISCRDRARIESENRQLINLNPDFPGLGNQNPFRCKFEVPDGATATLSRRQVNEIREIGRHDHAVRHAVELIVSQLSALTESSAKPDVIVLALPVPLIEKLVNAKSEEQIEGAEDDEDSDDTLNFRDLLKANTLHLDVPTQIVWPDTWDDAAKIPRKIKA